MVRRFAVCVLVGAVALGVAPRPAFGNHTRCMWQCAKRAQPPAKPLKPAAKPLKPATKPLKPAAHWPPFPYAPAQPLPWPPTPSGGGPIYRPWPYHHWSWWGHNHHDHGDDDDRREHRKKRHSDDDRREHRNKRHRDDNGGLSHRRHPRGADF